jgi:hypothetical protein
MPAVKKMWWYGYGAAFAGHMAAFSDSQFARSSLTRVRGALLAGGALRSLLRNQKL